MAASTIPGVSTVGVLIGYAFETSAGKKPTTFNLIHRVNAVDEIANETETIDASALEDTTERSIAGRGTTGGTFGITINLTNETIQEWEDIIEVYTTAKTSGLAMWYEEYNPNLEKAWFVKVEPPTKIPKPALDQNGLYTGTMTMTITDYVGPDTAIEPTEKE